MSYSNIPILIHTLYILVFVVFYSLGSEDIHATAKIKGCYSRLVLKVCKRLQEKSITIGDLHLFLTCLYSSDKSADGKVIADLILSASDLHTVFVCLNKENLMSYDKCSLLEEIVTTFANDEDIVQMVEQYKQDLDDFLLVTKPQEDKEYTSSGCDTSQASPGNQLILYRACKPHPRLFTVLRIKVSARHYIKLVKKHENHLSRLLKIRRAAMLFYEVTKGCVEISWFVPSNLVHQIKQRAQFVESVIYFEEEHITRVTLGDECIYPFAPRLDVEKKVCTL